MRVYVLVLMMLILFSGHAGFAMAEDLMAEVPGSLGPQRCGTGGVVQPGDMACAQVEKPPFGFAEAVFCMKHNVCTERSGSALASSAMDEEDLPSAGFMIPRALEENDEAGVSETSTHSFRPVGVGGLTMVLDGVSFAEGVTLLRIRPRSTPLSVGLGSYKAPGFGAQSMKSHRKTGLRRQKVHGRVPKEREQTPRRPSGPIPDESGEEMMSANYPDAFMPLPTNVLDTLPLEGDAAVVELP